MSLKRQFTKSWRRFKLRQVLVTSHVFCRVPHKDRAVWHRINERRVCAAGAKARPGRYGTLACVGHRTHECPTEPSRYVIRRAPIGAPSTAAVPLLARSSGERRTMASFPKNGFLSSLSRADRKLLEANASVVALDHGKQLQEQHARIENVYFPLNGIISLLTVMRNGTALESAMIGASGASGLAVGLGRPRAISRAMVQAPGTALRISAAHVLKAARQSATLAVCIGAHQEIVLAQVQQTAACNCAHTAEQRLSRWLLQAQDYLAAGETIPFTHEFLSSILGVRRSTVTLVAVSLQRSGSIHYKRGRIEILDKVALKASACECYGAILALSRAPLPTASGRNTK